MGLLSIQKVKRRGFLILGFLFYIVCSTFGSVATEFVFYQAAETTGGDAPVPQPQETLPAVVGMPSSPGYRGRQPSRDAKPSKTVKDESGRRKIEDSKEDNSVEEGENGGRSTKPLLSIPVAGKMDRSNTIGELRFNNAPITTVIKFIMDELKYPYVIDSQVSGTVNLFTAGEIPRDQLFEILERILKMNGYAIVKQDEFYIILPFPQSTKIPHRQILVKSKIGSKNGKVNEERKDEKKGKEQQAKPAIVKESGSQAETSHRETVTQQSEGSGPVAPQMSTQSDPSIKQVSRSEEGPQWEETHPVGQEQGVITYIIPLHYVPATDMVAMVKVFASDGANIVNFESANIILITDYWKNIEQALNLIRLLDTQYFEINTVDLISIRYNQAKDVAEDLGMVFAPGGKTAGVRIVAIERLNSILIVTRSPSVLQEVKKWLDRLDAPSTRSNVKTYVYEVEKNTAQNIAEVLAQLYQDGMGLPSTETGEGQEGQQQRAPIRPTQEASFSPFQGRGQRLGPSLAGRRMSEQGVRSVVAGDVKIVVNEFNNSLILQATEADYQFLLQTIQLLDVLPRQVLIEAKIYSVELRDDLSFGVAAFLAGRKIGDEVLPATIGQISAPTEGGPGGVFTMASRAAMGLSREFESVINALRSHTNVQMVEAPRLLAVDGMQAQINVGAEVPVTTASFGDPLRSGTASNFVNSIQFRPTGTTLLILPRTTASGIVTLDLAIEVSSATGTSLTPTISRNFVTTSLIVEDGQTVAIAGIISDQFDKGRSRIPILGDIPVLGHLFGQTSRTKRRFELIFLITPHVIRSLPTAAELTLDFRRSMRSAFDFIQEHEAEEEGIIQQRREKDLLREEDKEQQ